MSEQTTTSTAFKIILMVIATAFALWLAFELRNLFVCVIFALTLSSAITPVAEWGERRKIPRTWMVIFVYVAVAVIYSVVVVALIPAIKVQGEHLMENMPKYLVNVQDWLEHIKGGIGQKVEEIKIEDVLQNAAVKLGNQTLFVGAGVVEFIANGLLVLFLTAYFVSEAESIWPKLLLWVPPKHRATMASLIVPMSERMGGYVRGQVLVSIAVSTFLSIGLSALQVDYGLTIGVVAGLLNLVPFVGSMTALVLALVVAFNQSLFLAGATLLLFGLEQWVESNFIVPYLLGREVKLHPLLVLFAILIGASLMGVAGALVAVPVASALQLLAQEFYLKPLNASDPSAVTVSGAPTDPAGVPFGGYQAGDHCKIWSEGANEVDVILPTPEQSSLI